MLTIWKFPFDVEGEIKIQMPADARVLYVREQNGIPCLWAIVNPEAEVETRTFFLAGTGHEIPDGAGSHVGSFFLLEGRLVFHLFELEVR